MLVVFIELVDGKFSVAHTNFGKAFAMTHESPGFTHIRVLKDGRVRLGGGQMYTEFHSDTPSPSRVRSNNLSFQQGKRTFTFSYDENSNLFLKYSTPINLSPGLYSNDSPELKSEISKARRRSNDAFKSIGIDKKTSWWEELFVDYTEQNMPVLSYRLCITSPTLKRMRKLVKQNLSPSKVSPSRPSPRRLF